MPVLKHIGFLATCKADGGQGEIHALRKAALAWDGDCISWVGAEAELPKKYQQGESVDAGGRLVIPGLIDCHTHLAFGGWRDEEFERRIRGESYLEIAKKGGGILSTVNKTRDASAESLIERCLGFLADIAKLGVTTVECKSGYGLTLESELKLLRVYEELRRRQPLEIVSTFLGAHIVPPEYRENRGAYLKLLTEELIPLVAKEKLAEFCDVFVEETAFSKEEARAILEAGQQHGLRPKLHADQLSDGDGARLAATVGAISADHLEHVNDNGIKALAKANVVAVLLPLASLYTHEDPVDARKLVRAGVSVAVATDFNPGTAPSFHLPLAMMLACNSNRLTPHEALKGATLCAAKAIDREKLIGSVEVGKKADFAVIDAPDVNHWLYHFRANACVQVVKSGVFLNRVDCV